MTTIRSISNSTLSQPLETKSTNYSKRQVSDQQPQSIPRQGGGIISAIQEALNQMGLSTDSSSTMGGGKSSGITSATGTINTSTARKALYKFMHDLFTLMQERSNATSNIAAYSPPMTASIQDIIQALQSSSSITGSYSSNTDVFSTQTSALNNLKSDFQSLITAIGGDFSTGSSSKSLFTFLQNIEANLNRQESPSIHFINTMA